MASITKTHMQIAKHKEATVVMIIMPPNLTEEHIISNASSTLLLNYAKKVEEEDA